MRGTVLLQLLSLKHVHVAWNQKTKSNNGRV